MSLNVRSVKITTIALTASLQISPAQASFVTCVTELLHSFGDDEKHAIPPKSPPQEFFQGRRVYHSSKELPLSRLGFVRVYRGTNSPGRVQMSQSERVEVAKNPNYTPRSGETNFLTYSEAKIHAFNIKGNPEAVSVTTDFATAKYASNGVLVYDIPKDIFENLPIGDPGQVERDFKYSIPDKWVVGLIPVNTSYGP